MRKEVKKLPVESKFHTVFLLSEEGALYKHGGAALYQTVNSGGG